MRKFLLFFSAVFCLASCQTQSFQTAKLNVLYASPAGTSDGAGTIHSPMNIQSAISHVNPGQTIFLLSGTYTLRETIKISRNNSGTEKAIKTLAAIKPDAVILNFSALPVAANNKGIVLNGSYWQIRDLIVEKAGDNGIYIGGSHNQVLGVTTRFNADTGIQLGRISQEDTKNDWPANNLVAYSISHDNRDPSGENADGFAAKLTTGEGNIFDHCIAYHNVDDGWDLFTKPETGPIGAVTIRNSIAYKNGILSDGTIDENGDGNGFKLGGRDIPVPHILLNNVAIDNLKHGYTFNRNTGAMKLNGNIGLNNIKTNFNFPRGKARFNNTLSCKASGTKKDKYPQGVKQMPDTISSEQCSLALKAATDRLKLALQVDDLSSN